jgi:hypothetical protein
MDPRIYIPLCLPSIQGFLGRYEPSSRNPKKRHRFPFAFQQPII